MITHIVEWKCETCDKVERVETKVDMYSDGIIAPPKGSGWNLESSSAELWCKECLDLQKVV